MLGAWDQVFCVERGREIESKEGEGEGGGGQTDAPSCRFLTEQGAPEKPKRINECGGIIT